MRDPSEHIAAMLAASPDRNPGPLVIALLCDYSTAHGYIEGSKIGLERLMKEVAFWKDLAMQPAKSRQALRKAKS